MKTQLALAWEYATDAERKTFADSFRKNNLIELWASLTPIEKANFLRSIKRPVAPPQAGALETILIESQKSEINSAKGKLCRV